MRLEIRVVTIDRVTGIGLERVLLERTSTDLDRRNRMLEEMLLV